MSLKREFRENQLHKIRILLQGVNKFIVAYFRIFERFGWKSMYNISMLGYWMCNDVLWVVLKLAQGKPYIT